MSKSAKSRVKGQLSWLHERPRHLDFTLSWLEQLMRNRFTMAEGCSIERCDCILQDEFLNCMEKSVAIDL